MADGRGPQVVLNRRAIIPGAGSTYHVFRSGIVSVITASLADETLRRSIPRYISVLMLTMTQLLFTQSRLSNLAPTVGP
jgi:hypothetical protein